MLHSSSQSERDRWNRKQRDADFAGADLRKNADLFLEFAFSEYIRPLYLHGGTALDLAGGIGRHSIWMARQGWEVTLIDISEVGVAKARQNAGPLAPHIDFVLDDLTHFDASQTAAGKQHAGAFDVVMNFFYLERKIFPELVNALRPGGLLIYKTYTAAQAELADGPKNPCHLLESGELERLAGKLEILHHRERIGETATAELVARKKTVGSAV
jgi:tellurite methyltransferase